MRGVAGACGVGGALALSPQESPQPLFIAMNLNRSYRRKTETQRETLTEPEREERTEVGETGRVLLAPGWY